MNGNHDFRDLLQCLNEADARYLIVGAYAVIFHTEPRYTKDLDIWADPTPENAQKIPTTWIFGRTQRRKMPRKCGMLSYASARRWPI